VRCSPTHRRVVTDISITAPFTFERLDKDKALLLIVDHQLGLLQLVRDYTVAEFRNNVFAHAEIGKLFNLPVIMTTSAETGMMPCGDGWTGPAY
jgi:hypothetical protein